MFAQMFEKFKIKSLVVIAVLTFGVMFLYSHTPKVESQSEYPKLTLEVSSPQNEYFQHEPILFKFRVTNQTNEPIVWQSLVKIGPWTNLIVRNQSGGEVKIEGKKLLRAGISIFPSKLNPAENYETQSLVNGYIAEEIFPNPGRYEVRIELIYNQYQPVEERKTVVSNPIVINILEPQDINRQAYNFIKEKLTPTKKGRLSSSELTQLEQEFVNRFSGSVYADFMRVELAQLYEIIGEDTKALQELCKISSDEDFYHAKQVQRRIRQIDAKINPPDMRELPPDVPMPVRQDPCLRVQN